MYAKPPPGGPAQVLEYLARYTHWIAISNERILGVDREQVRLRVSNNQSGGKRVVTLAADDFIGRFLCHVLPRGFKRIRHYGLLAPGQKRNRLAAARAALHMPEPQPLAIEAAEAFLKRVSGHDPRVCPHCAHGRWQPVQIVPALRRDEATPAPRCRDGPL